MKSFFAEALEFQQEPFERRATSRLIGGFQVLIVAAFMIAGCSIDSTGDGLNEAPTGQVFGGPSNDEIFAPYQGEWALVDRTFDPPLAGSTITGGPDISITGHIIRFGTGTSARELRLCQTRRIDEGIECEAWHHENIGDPGDMQRADCKLQKVGDELKLAWRIAESGDFSNDPIIAAADYVLPNRQKVDPDMAWWVETYTRKTAK